VFSKIIIVPENNYRYEVDQNLSLPNKEKDKRVVLENIGWVRILNVAFSVVN
jgi:hypothetical protein